MSVHRVTMDEAKEVHTNLRNAAGIFKFVKVSIMALKNIDLNIQYKPLVDYS